jgi:aarF domain-containing kinase
MWHTGMPAMLQSSEEQGEVTVALTSVFAEALKGGVSNLSFGDLSGQLGARGGGVRVRIPRLQGLASRIAAPPPPPAA